MPLNSISYYDNLYYGASTEIINRAKEHRLSMTPAEKTIWEKLNKGQIHDLKFRRQHPISNFIADFYCHKLKLVIEIDGKYHGTLEQYNHDQNRSAEFNRFQIKVIRFTNEEVLNNIEEVISKIELQCKLLQALPLTP
jgi:very-short-patch-repair endonuclease